VLIILLIISRFPEAIALVEWRWGIVLIAFFGKISLEQILCLLLLVVLDQDSTESDLVVLIVLSFEQFGKDHLLLVVVDLVLRDDGAVNSLFLAVHGEGAHFLRLRVFGL
jgi:hypothetical protein